VKPIVCCDRERAEGGDAWAAIGAALSHTAPPPRVAPDLRPDRRRLWQLREKHHCVLLGAAFDARELRQLFRRAGYEDWRAASDYALHATAVNHAQKRGDLSQLMQKKLEERCGAAVARFRAAESRVELIGLWRDWAAKGEHVAAYWAALTHPRCDVETDELLYHDMHMLAHFAFAERRASVRRLRDADERSARLEATLARAQAQCSVLRVSAESARGECDRARRELARANATLARWTDGDEARAREARIRALEDERDAARRNAAEAQRELAALRRRSARETGPSPRPTGLGPSVSSAPAPVEPARAAPADLTAKRLLCVGGKTRLVPQYRAAVESANGVFLYHDGGVEDHLSRLPAMLRSADAVVCLAGDVSHCAYYAVKRYCKRFGKSCALLANSSASALSQGLQQVA
jgi:hypothetical protein